MENIELELDRECYLEEDFTGLAEKLNHIEYDFGKVFLNGKPHLMEIEEESDYFKNWMPLISKSFPFENTAV